MKIQRTHVMRLYLEPGETVEDLSKMLGKLDYDAEVTAHDGYLQVSRTDEDDD